MSDLFDLTGKTALVTGSTRGLGLAMAHALSRAGARVCINGRTQEACEAVLWPGAIAAPFDATDEGAVAEGIAAIGQVDVVVNNAAVRLRGSLERLALEDWRRLADGNVTSAFLVTRAVAPQMIERGSGKIINICSIMSEIARHEFGAYATSKGALKLLTRAMCADWGRYGIQANGIGPGYFRTEANRAVQEDPEMNAWLKLRLPAGRWAEPSELDGVVVFLASRASDFVNGQIIFVDGGLLAVL